MRRTRNLTSSIVGLGSGLLLAGCAPTSVENLAETKEALSQGLASESEPNDTVATAKPIGTDTVVRGNLFPVGDADYFAFEGTAGDRAYIALMTSSTPNAASDSQLTLYQPDGTTTLEFDDDAGSLANLSSAIGGAILTETGTHYIKVNHFDPMIGLLFPYDLHLKVQSGSPVPETEPNDMVPELLPPSGWVSGALSDTTDVDVFAVQVNAGDTIYANLDLDPTRDGTEWNGLLGIGPFGPTNVSLGANDAGNTTDPDAEALMVTVKNSGSYAIGVQLPTGTTIGDYDLSVSVHPATEIGRNCTTYTSTDPPQVIPTGPGQIASTIVVPGNPRIEDIDVSLQLTHSFPQDLDIYLTSPVGNNNGLLSDCGGGALTPFTAWDVTFDDQAASPAGIYQVVNGLVLQPERDFRLNWLKGEDAGGTWTLNVLDDTMNNGGELTSWSITICEPLAEPTCAGGGALVPVFSTDFESGDAGFTHSGTQDEWALGTPMATPIDSCNSGTNCWKTDLTGTYNASCTQNLTSVTIDLTNKIAPIQLQWAMKYQMDTAAKDRAFIEVQEVGGANPRRVWQHLDGAMTTPLGNPITTIQESAGWGIHTADISAYADKQIEVVFHVSSDASVQLAGLAIDDVSVSACNAVCGDGVQNGGEACEDGNTTDGDGCDSNCTFTGCGNGITTMGEACDDGNTTDGDGCDNNCTMTACGNGIVTMGEACDDGNPVEGDGCDTNCTVSACGNGIKADTEACDDGNTTNDDGCDSNCTFTGCGNGIATMGEACDDGNPVEGDGCDTNCTVSACGNGIIVPPEVCDDGNTTNGDGCDDNCIVTGCGNGVVTGTETCDDGNMTDGDGCDTNCTPTGCGNGIVTPPEECDDGNTTAGDGCDTSCKTEGVGGAGGGGAGGTGGAGGGGMGGAGGGTGGAATGGGGNGGGMGGIGGEAGEGGAAGKVITEGGGCACTTVGTTESTKSSFFALLGLVGMLGAKLRRRK